MIGWQRLDVEHIEPGTANGAAFERMDHRSLVDDGAARRVDEEGVRPHQREFRGPNKAARAVRQFEMHTDHIGFAEQSCLIDPTNTYFTFQLSDHLPLWVELNLRVDEEQLDQMLNRKKL